MKMIKYRTIATFSCQGVTGFSFRQKHLFHKIIIVVLKNKDIAERECIDRHTMLGCSSEN